MNPYHHCLPPLGYGKLIYVPRTQHVLSVVSTALMILREVSELALDSDLLPLLTYFAYVQAPEILDKVLETHPESAVITELRLDHAYYLISPVVRVFIRPVAFPFELAPWIPYINKLIPLILLHLYH